MHRFIDRTIFSLCITQPTTHLVEKTNTAGLKRINRYPLSRVVDVNDYFYRITIKPDDVDYICDQETHTSLEWVYILCKKQDPINVDEKWAMEGNQAYSWLTQVESSKGSFTFYEWLNEFRPYWNKKNEAAMSAFFLGVIKKRIESLRCGDASIPSLDPVVSFIDYSDRVVETTSVHKWDTYKSTPHELVSENRTYVSAPLPKDAGCTVKRVHVCSEQKEEEYDTQETNAKDKEYYHQMTSGGGGVDDKDGEPLKETS